MLTYIIIVPRKIWFYHLNNCEKRLLDFDDVSFTLAGKIHLLEKYTNDLLTFCVLS